MLETVLFPVIVFGFICVFSIIGYLKDRSLVLGKFKKVFYIDANGKEHQLKNSNSIKRLEFDSRVIECAVGFSDSVCKTNQALMELEKAFVELSKALPTGEEFRNYDI